MRGLVHLQVLAIICVAIGAAFLLSSMRCQLNTVIAEGCGDGYCDAGAGEGCDNCMDDCGLCIYCGDGSCNGVEDCGTCSTDCGSCSYCGDGICQEDCSTCSADCGNCYTPTCGDGTCEYGETSCSCPNDCGIYCGDGCCIGGENACSCSSDCSSTSCGDGCCSTGETSCNCSSDCGLSEPMCGDGCAAGSETCDDGNASDDDGCTTSCYTEFGWTCSSNEYGTSSCVTTCGDGYAAAGTEACDDGNINNGDGCSSACVVESGWACDTSIPNVCQKCGNGTVEGTEACDDGNAVSSDGCSNNCAIENGYSCSGVPSACVTSCGDGIKVGSEECDDSNQVNGDGCNSACQNEPSPTVEVAPTAMSESVSLASSDTGSSGGSDPVSQPENAPSIAQGEKDSHTGKRTIAAKPEQTVKISVKPVDADRLKSVYVRMGSATYYLTDPDGDLTYTTTLPMPKLAGSYAYTLTANYGTTTRSEKGNFVVAPDMAVMSPVNKNIINKNEEASQEIALTTPKDKETKTPLVPAMELTEPTVVVVDTSESAVDLSEVARVDKGEPVFPDTAPTTLSVIGQTFNDSVDQVHMTLNNSRVAIVVVGNVLKETAVGTGRVLGATVQGVIEAVSGNTNEVWKKTTVAYREAVQKVSSSAREVVSSNTQEGQQLPEQLRDHRYEEVRVLIANEQGQPLAGALVTLLSEPKVTTTDRSGTAVFRNIEAGNHTLKVAFGAYQSKQPLFLAYEAPKVEVSINAEFKEGKSGLWWLGAAVSVIIAVVAGSLGTWWVINWRQAKGAKNHY